MHDDVVRPTRFGVAGEVEHNVEVLVRARHDRLGIAPAGLDRKLEGPLAFVDRHREELALLPADEEALDAEVLGPVADILGEAVLVDSELVVERHEGGRQDTGHGCSGVFFGPVSGVLHAQFSCSASDDLDAVGHVLDHGVVVESLGAAFAAVPARLHPTEGRFGQ